MTDQNPYHYEGTAESLNSTPVRASGVIGISGKSYVVTLITAIVAGWMFDPAWIESFLALSLFLLFPISAFGFVFRRTLKLGYSQLAYWLASGPLAIYFVTLINDNNPTPNHAVVLGWAGLIGYAILLVPTSLALLFFAARSDAVADW